MLYSPWSLQDVHRWNGFVWCPALPIGREERGELKPRPLVSNCWEHQLTWKPPLVFLVIFLTMLDRYAGSKVASGLTSHWLNTGRIWTPCLSQTLVPKTRLRAAPWPPQCVIFSLPSKYQIPWRLCLQNAFTPPRTKPSESCEGAHHWNFYMTNNSSVVLFLLPNSRWPLERSPKRGKVQRQGQEWPVFPKSCHGHHLTLDMYISLIFSGHIFTHLCAYAQDNKKSFILHKNFKLTFYLYYSYAFISISLILFSATLF